MKQAVAFHQSHPFGGGFDNVDNNAAGIEFFHRSPDQILRIIAPLGNRDEGIFFLKLLDVGAKPGVRIVEGELPFALGAFDQNLFPIRALIERQLRD